MKRIVELGRPFQIINVRTKRLLEAVFKEGVEREQCFQPTLGPENVAYKQQTWIFCPHPNKTEEHVIVLAFHDLALASKKSGVFFSENRAVSASAWHLEMVGKDTFTIELAADRRVKLCVQDTLTAQIATTISPNEQWQFVPHSKVEAFNRSCTVSLLGSNRFLTCPFHQSQGDQEYLKYQNFSFNQRWLVSRVGDAILIRSLVSALCLDVQKAHFVDGNKVILYSPHGGINQLWQIVPAPGPNLVNCYQIKPLKTKDLILSQSQNFLELSSKNKCVWHIESSIL